MSATQYIDLCADHDGCATITCQDNDVVFWVSHIVATDLPDGTTVEMCANDSYPVVDRRL